MSADGHITRDGERLVAYLVQLALEGVDRMEAEPLDEYGRGDFGISAKGRKRLREHLSERMRQAAQTIVCEVAETEREGVTYVQRVASTADAWDRAASAYYASEGTDREWRAQQAARVAFNAALRGES